MGYKHREADLTQVTARRWQLRICERLLAPAKPPYETIALAVVLRWFLCPEVIGCVKLA